MQVICCSGEQSCEKSGHTSSPEALDLCSDSAIPIVAEAVADCLPVCAPALRDVSCHDEATEVSVSVKGCTCSSPVCLSDRCAMFESDPCTDCLIDEVECTMCVSENAFVMSVTEKDEDGHLTVDVVQEVVPDDQPC